MYRHLVCMILLDSCGFMVTRSHYTHAFILYLKHSLLSLYNVNEMKLVIRALSVLHYAAGNWWCIIVFIAGVCISLEIGI